MTTADTPAIPLSRLPGPRGWPVLGNLPQLDFPRFHRQLEAWADTYGDFYRLRFGPRECLVTTDFEASQILLKERPGHFGRQRTIQPVFDELGLNGVFSAEDEDWRRQRRIVISALNSAHLNPFYASMKRTTERLERRWRRAAEARTVVDLPSDLMRYTVDITTQLAFGIDFNTLETEGHVIQEDLDKVFPMLNARLAAPFPWWRYIQFRRDRELANAVQSVQARISGIVADCRARLASRPELRAAPSNFLEAMIVAQEEEGVPFSERDIVANVFTLLLAGEDTTANTLAWAMKMFIDHPALLAEVRAELDARLGAATIPPDYAAASDFPVLEAFANETMRLKPVAPLNGFGVKTEMDLCGVRLPAGAGVFLLTRRLATRPAHFHHPLEFLPARWSEGGNAPGHAHNARAFMPFGGGPRFCPGRNLALLEIRVVLAMACRAFDFELAHPEVPVEEEFAFTMGPAHLDVRLRPRASA